MAEKKLAPQEAVDFYRNNPEGLSQERLDRDFKAAFGYLPPKGGSLISKESADAAVNTLKNIGKVYPVAELAAQVATSFYGMPISGLAALADFGGSLIITKDVDEALASANRTLEATQKYLIHQPKAKASQELSEAAMYPVEMYGKGTQALGDYASKWSPEAGAAVQTAAEMVPELLGAKGMVKGTPRGVAKTQRAKVQRGIEKGVKPVKTTGSKYYSDYKKYMAHANSAVDSIIKRKDQLQFVDPDGFTTSGRLPRSVDEFSQAIEQSKRAVFKEYDDIIQKADASGIKVRTDSIISELADLINDPDTRTWQLDKVKYAEQRMKSLIDETTGFGKEISPTSAQNAIQTLNQTLEKFYRDGSPEWSSKSQVDALIANKLRNAIGDAIDEAGVKNANDPARSARYQQLKKEYGSLRMIEQDVIKRAAAEAKKSDKGFFDFSDILSSSQITYGVTAGQPALVAAGTAAKIVAMYNKYRNNPNTHVRKMFKRAERAAKRPQRKPVLKAAAAHTLTTLLPAHKQQQE